MTLAELVSADQIVPALQSRERWSVIMELASRLFTLGRVPERSRAVVLHRLHDRELRLTTGIGSGVAIPHALCPHSRSVAAVLGLSREGVDFEAADGALVHIVVLFVVPESEYRLRLETLSAIGKSLGQAELRERLLNARSAGEIRSLLSGRPRGATRRLTRA